MEAMILGVVCLSLVLVIVILICLHQGAISRLDEASIRIAETERRYGEAHEGWGHALSRNYELQREYEKVLENWKELTGYADELRGIGQDGDA